jgi:hypothetical protein
LIIPRNWSIPIPLTFENLDICEAIVDSFIHWQNFHFHPGSCHWWDNRELSKCVLVCRHFHLAQEKKWTLVFFSFRAHHQVDQQNWITQQRGMKQCLIVMLTSTESPFEKMIFTLLFLSVTWILFLRATLSTKNSPSKSTWKISLIFKICAWFESKDILLEVLIIKPESRSQHPVLLMQILFHHCHQLLSHKSKVHCVLMMLNNQLWEAGRNLWNTEKSLQWVTVCEIIQWSPLF